MTERILKDAKSHFDDLVYEYENMLESKDKLEERIETLENELQNLLDNFIDLQQQYNELLSEKE